MKYIFVLVCLLISKSFVSYSQGFKGTIHYVESYNWIKTYDSLSFYSDDYRKTLLLRYHEPITYRSFSLIANSDSSHYQETSASSISNKHFYRFNWTENTAIITGELKKKDFLVKDTITSPNWIVQDEIKEILGHICMKAVTYDRSKKQQIVAWFALDIPAPIGPAHYIGLPGLILEIDINNGARVLKATSISSLAPTFPILPKKLPRNVYSNASLNEYIREEMTRLLSNNQYPFHLIPY